MKYNLIYFFCLLCLFGHSQVKLDTTRLKGINYGRNLIVLNPYNSNGSGYGVIDVLINNKLAKIDLLSSLFEVDFTLNRIRRLDSVDVKIIHSFDAPPKIYNLECILDPNLEAIGSLDSSSKNANYALKDKSICIITGNLVRVDKTNTGSYYAFGWERLSNNSNKFGTTMGNPNKEGKYIGVLTYDELYSINLYLDVGDKSTVVNRFLIDLRGIPEDKKRGQLINLDILVRDDADQSFNKLRQEFPTKKLYFNSFYRSLVWDQDYANAIYKTSEILTKQLAQEGILQKSEYDRTLKQLEINKNKLDIRAKNFEIEKQKLNNVVKEKELLTKEFKINNQKNEIERQELNDQIRKKEINEKSLLITQERKKKVYLYIIIFVALILCLGAIIAFFYQKRLRKVIDLKKIEVEEQKNLIEEKHKEITDSINYAERIQRSFLATKKLLEENLKEYFVLFQPKDVVSGDFYWGGQLSNGNFALVTADSTGHGVPGAIMSILNISCIENATGTERLSEPASILNHTRVNIIERLKNDGSAEGGKDGMDCSLVSFDFVNKRLIYAAANNPVWVVRNNNLLEFDADKMPVGKHDRDSVSFTQHTVELQKNDMVYTLTDGFPDQFGGPKGKKFMYKKLKELLISISELPLSEQKSKLSNTLSDWKGTLEQVDDVCVIGIKL